MLLLLGLFVAGIAVAAIPIDLKKDKIENVYSIDQETPAIEVITINVMATVREATSAPGDMQNDQAIPVDNLIRARSHWRTRPSLNYLIPSIDVDYPYSPSLARPPAIRHSLLE